MLIWRSIRHAYYNMEERLLRLRFRDLINGNPKIVIGLSVASGVLFLLIVAVLSIPHNLLIASKPKKVWFYDLNTKKLFVANGDNIPPIDAPSGKLADGRPAGVRAYVFSYVDDPKESECFIGYLEKFTPEGEQMIASILKSKSKVTSQMARQLNKNRFVRRVADNDWYSADSQEGRLVLEQLFHANESGQTPLTYQPK